MDTQKPLNRALPAKDLFKKARKPSLKPSKRTKPSVNQKVPKYHKNISDQMETSDDADTVSMYTSDLEDFDFEESSADANKNTLSPPGAHGTRPDFSKNDT